MNLRYLRKKDGSLVLQQLIHTNPVLHGYMVFTEPKYEWQDVPIINEGEEECTR